MSKGAEGHDDSCNTTKGARAIEQRGGCHHKGWQSNTKDKMAKTTKPTTIGGNFLAEKVTASLS